MEYKAYYLKFTSPLHIGNQKPDSYESTLDYIHSDTLYAAIYATWAKMGLSHLIPADGVPPFTISSAFPYISQESGKIHYFPRPYTKLRINTDFFNTWKQFKKVRWIDESYFTKIVNDLSLFEDANQTKDLKGEFLTGVENPEFHFRKEQMDRVTIDRKLIDSDDARPYMMERLYFNNSGLFFLVKNDNRDLQDAMNLLGLEGIGTDRSVGNGLFDLELGSFNISISEETNFGINLGLYIPSSLKEFKNVTDSSLISFNSIRRGGWITKDGYLTIEKKSIRMFEEGGMWKVSSPILGNAAIDLKPSFVDLDHPIWRNGRTIFLPCKINES